MLHLQAGVAGEPVVVVEVQRAQPQAEAGHHPTARIEVPGHVGHDRRLGARLDEDHDVACQHDQVELSPPVGRVGRSDLHSGEVAQDPRNVRGLAAGLLQHAGVEVHAHDVDAPAVELDGDPPGPAAGVQHRAGLEPAHQVGLAVDPFAPGLHAPPAVVVDAAMGRPADLPPPVHLADPNRGRHRPGTAAGPSIPATDPRPGHGPLASASTAACSDHAPRERSWSSGFSRTGTFPARRRTYQSMST